MTIVNKKTPIKIPKPSAKFVPENFFVIINTFKDASNVGVIEAPRGTLYYQLKIKKDGLVKDGAIIVPTQQNQINMKNDIWKLVQDSIGKRRSWLVKECEKLIRAYDPCMSCASHFLRVKWV